MLGLPDDSRGHPRAARRFRLRRAVVSPCATTGQVLDAISLAGLVAAA